MGPQVINILDHLVFCRQWLFMGVMINEWISSLYFQPVCVKWLLKQFLLLCTHQGVEHIHFIANHGLTKSKWSNDSGSVYCYWVCPCLFGAVVTATSLQICLAAVCSPGLTCTLERPHPVCDTTLPFICCSYKGDSKKGPSIFCLASKRSEHRSIQLTHKDKEIKSQHPRSLCTLDKWGWLPQQIDSPTRNWRRKASEPTSRQWSSASRTMRLCANSVWTGDVCLRTPTSQPSTSHWVTMSWDRTHPRPGG